MENRKNSTVFTALILIILGGIFLLKNFNMLNFAIPWHYFSFALIPIFIGIRTIIDRNYYSGIFITLIGVAFYIPRFLNTEQRIAYRNLWPLALILIGVYILLEKSRNKHFLPVNEGFNNDNYIEENNIFSGSSKNYATQSFKGGKINCIMGGSEMDLSSAKMVSPAELQINCIMGGVELKIPRDWNVQAKINPILGGIEDKGGNTLIDTNKILIITGTVIMGGVEIRRY